MARRKLSRGLLVAIAIVLVASLALGGYLFETSPYAVDTNTVPYSFAGATGRGGYTFPGDKHELLARENYVTSWDPTLNGQQVAWSVDIILSDDACLARYAACIQVSLQRVDVAVQLVAPGGDRVILKYNRYDLSANPPFCGRSPFFQQPCPVTWSKSDVVDLRHPDGKTIIPSGWTVDVAVVSYVQWYSQASFDNCAPCDQGSGLAATDRAILYSGIGQVHFEGGHADGAGGIYVVTGETLKACWSVGYSSEAVSGTGWSMQIFSQAQNRLVLGPTRIAATNSQLQGCLDYTSVDADFKYNTTGNQLVVTLKNELWSHDTQAISTVRAGDVARMPTCYDDGFTPESPKQGDVITYKFHCVPANSNPQNAVKSIKVEWGYGDFTNVAILDGAATQYQFTAGSAGIINLALTGYTADGVPSGAHNYRVSVEHQPTNDCYGSVQFCNPTPPSVFSIPLWVIFVLIGVVAMLIAFLIPRSVPIPFTIRLVIGLVGIIFILIGVIFLR